MSFLLCPGGSNFLVSEMITVTVKVSILVVYNLFPIFGVCF